MIKNTQIFWIITIVAIFTIGNFFFLADANYILSTVPLGLALLLLGFMSLDSLLLLIVFFTPLSVRLQEFIPTAPFDISLPSEPYLVFMMGIFTLKLISEKEIDKRVFKHPISFAIYFYLTWKLITCLTSTMVIVSLKQFIAQIWFISSYYFVAVYMFTNITTIKRYIWAYAGGLLIVAAYTIIHHAINGFTQKSAHWVMSPFYKDHTSYGAVLAFIIPPILALRKIARKDISINFFYWFSIFFLFVALILSYTRAAWLSLVGAFGIWIIVKLRIKFRTLALIVVSTLILIAPFATDILIHLKQNEKESSTDFKEHVSSMSNISSDASNLERINRWNCAIRMFKVKPFLGWGPGTYMFKYAPFQLSSERTIISTNAGTLGNAHSEYLGRLAESGIPGTLLFLTIIIVTLYKAFSLYTKIEEIEIKAILLSSILALITYYLHSFLNNFLDTDKLASLFWGFTAIIAAIDIHRSKILQK